MARKIFFVRLLHRSVCELCNRSHRYGIVSGVKIGSLTSISLIHTISKALLICHSIYVRVRIAEFRLLSLLNFIEVIEIMTPLPISLFLDTLYRIFVALNQAERIFSERAVVRYEGNGVLHETGEAAPWIVI